MAQNTRPSNAERLDSKIDRSGGPDACWPFTGKATGRSGHAEIWWNGTMRKAHRMAYETFVGPIPDGMCVCHRCDNPPCCNPAHLWLGTVADNNADRDRKGRGVVPTGDQVRRQTPGPLPHGTIYGYVKRKCRCDDCRKAIREYRHERKRIAAQVAALDKVVWP